MKPFRALACFITILSLLLPSLAAADISSVSVLIVEIQTGSLNSASEEFVELYNTTDEAIDLSDWKLEYFSSGSVALTNPSRTMPLRGKLESRTRYLLTSTNYLINLADDTFAATLAKSGGHLRLVSAQEGEAAVRVHDLIGWGTAASPEAQAAVAPSEGQSLQRKTDDQGLYVDTDNNGNDFAVNPMPTPESTNQEDELPEPEEEISLPPEEPIAETNEPAPVETPEEPADSLLPPEAEPQIDIPAVPEPPAAPLYLPISITELLPNPAAPFSDDQDEYVELFNPNPEPLELAGYKLQTGTNFSYSFNFTSQTILPLSYLALYSAESNLVLANSGSKARLIDDTGQVVDEVPAYDEAKAGEAWALIDSVWQWTTSPTAAAANILTIVPPPTPKSSTTPVTKPRATPKKAAAPKVKAAKTTKQAAPKSTKTAATKKPKATSAQERASYQEPASLADQPGQLHNSILAGVGGLTLIYAAYEYRHDAANALYRYKRYREARRARRPAS